MGRHCAPRRRRSQVEADDHARSNLGGAYACPVNAARPGNRRPMAPREANYVGIDVALVQFGAVFENVPQAGKNRLVGAAGCLVNTLPIARTRSPRKATDETGGE